MKMQKIAHQTHTNQSMYISKCVIVGVDVIVTVLLPNDSSVGQYSMQSYICSSLRVQGIQSRDAMESECATLCVARRRKKTQRSSAHPTPLHATHHLDQEERVGTEEIAEMSGLGLRK